MYSIEVRQSSALQSGPLIFQVVTWPCVYLLWYYWLFPMLHPASLEGFEKKDELIQFLSFCFCGSSFMRAGSEPGTSGRSHFIIQSKTQLCSHMTRVSHTPLQGLRDHRVWLSFSLGVRKLIFMNQTILSFCSGVDGTDCCLTLTEWDLGKYLS